jgi:hypothetical protein
MPTASELLPVVRRFTDLADEITDVEQLLSYLQDPQPFLDKAQILENQAIFERVRGGIADHIADAEGQVLSRLPPFWLLDFAAAVGLLEGVVITYNYDTLIERAAWYLRNGQLPVFKLHGSLSESWDPDYPDEIAVDVGRDWTGPSYPWQRRGRMGAFVVPPVVSKQSFYGTKDLRDRWLQASGALGQATHLAVLGYSVPQADFASSYLLRSSRSADEPCRLLIADLEPEPVADRLLAILGRGPHVEFSGLDAIPQAVDEIANRGMHHWWATLCSVGTDAGPADHDSVAVYAAVRLSAKTEWNDWARAAGAGMPRPWHPGQSADLPLRLAIDPGSWRDVRSEIQSMMDATGRIEGRVLIESSWMKTADRWRLRLNLTPRPEDQVMDSEAWVERMRLPN